MESLPDEIQTEGDKNQVKKFSQSVADSMNAAFNRLEDLESEGVDVTDRKRELEDVRSNLKRLQNQLDINIEGV